MFTVRKIHAEQSRLETAQYDLVPTLDQGVTVCNLFAAFLAGQPAEFRTVLPFLNRTAIEMDWAAAGHGAAFFGFLHANSTLAAGVLLGGADTEADARMIAALRESIVEPMTGDGGLAAPGPDCPAAVIVEFHDQPELVPAVRLLSTALGSVYFRAVSGLAAAGREAS